MVRFYSRRHAVSLAVILLLGALLRVWAFPNVPPGLNQDEVSAGYETYSLILTGKDRWGNVWPAYFPSWGSGQNVLYSYLSIPFIKVFGLTATGIRAVSVLIGILTLPLVYLTTRRVYGRKVALIATAGVSFLPWNVMASRWGLESNLLPFFLLLGFYTFLSAVRKPLWAPIALVPWALALYAYGLSVLVVPVLTALLTVRYRSRITAYKFSWGIGLAIGLFFAVPFLAHFAKNSLHISGVGDHILGMSIPKLPASRLSQISKPLPSQIGANLNLLVSGFNDGQLWNSTVHGPLLMTLFPFLAVALVRPLRRNIGDPFFLWLIACLPLFIAVSLNMNRVNAILIPVVALSALGFQTLLRRLGRHALSMKKATYGWTIASCLVFFAYYFGPYRRTAAGKFNVGLTNAVDDARRLASPAEPVLISPSVRLAYLYVLMHDKVSPAEFQKTGPHDFVDGVTVVDQVNDVYFWPDRLPVGVVKCYFVEPVKEGDKVRSHELSKTYGWSIRRQDVRDLAPMTHTAEP